MPFYPALPETKPANLALDFAGGMLAGEKLQEAGLRLGAERRALQRYDERQQALRQYQQTGDIGPVMAADPEFGLKLQAELRKLGAEERRMAAEQITHAATFMEKVLPFLPNRPDRWQAFRQDASVFPILRNMIPEQYDPEWVENARGMVINAKTAVARINAESRGKAARLGYEGRIGAAEIGAKSRAEVARISAAKPSAAGRVLRWDEFWPDYQGRHPGATMEEGLKEYNRAIAAGKAAGAATKPLTREQKAKAEAAELKTSILKPFAEKLKKKFGAGVVSGEAAGRQEFDAEPPATDHPGKRLVKPDGTEWRSDGKEWVRVK